jgi:hypothetical protein
MEAGGQGGNDGVAATDRKAGIAPILVRERCGERRRRAKLRVRERESWSWRRNR